jgi:hypothetical protein
LNGREKVFAKNGPFSLAFCQMVALMLPHRSVFGIVVGSIYVSSFVELNLALSRKEESHCALLEET